MSAGGARIGTRGPGETQLEVDRRRILRRIHKLEAELREIDKHRATQRKAQHRSRTRRVAIVGYTNAGKSTLLNQLTDAGVLVEDRLFATLDATTRRLDLPGGEAVLLTDTVGFIRKLPAPARRGLQVDARRWRPTPTCSCTWSTRRPSTPRATSRPCARCCGRSAPTRCPSCSRSTRPTSPPSEADAAGRRLHAGLGGLQRGRPATGVEELLRTVGDRLRALTNVVELPIPYDRGDVLAAVHREGEVLVELPDDDGHAAAGPARRRRRSASFVEYVVA